MAKKRVLQVSFDIMIDADKSYNDLITELEECGVFNDENINVLAYDFKGDLSELYAKEYGYEECCN